MREALDRWQHHEGYITRAGDGIHMPGLPNDRRLSDRELYVYYAAFTLGLEIGAMVAVEDETAAQVIEEIIGDD